jgi:hypothetical protein
MENRIYIFFDLFLGKLNSVLKFKFEMDLSTLPEEIIIKIFKEVVTDFLKEKKLNLKWAND